MLGREAFGVAGGRRGGRVDGGVRVMRWAAELAAESYSVSYCIYIRKTLTDYYQQTG
jgi:hypothetical protein